MTNQKKLAESFNHLHYNNNSMLVLPNIWNAGSAVIFEKQGFQAVATTSAGIAYSLGYADGEIINVDDLCTIVHQICKRISIPLSVDMENGYGDTPEIVKHNVKKIIEAGAVGINIEDGLPDGSLADPKLQVAKMKAILELKQELDIPFVLNARTCVYWLGIGENKQEQLELALNRCKAYAEAGADCVFVPGALDQETVKQLRKTVKIPLNIIANPVFNDFQNMNDIGVNRLSIGSGAVRAVCAHIQKIGKELTKGKLDTILSHDFSYAKANELFGNN